MNKAIVIADSINVAGNRLTTIEVTLPRCVLAEFNTHRAHSRNSASSRAIPSERLISAIVSAPFVPKWTAANKGMVAAGPLDPALCEDANAVWLSARDFMVECVGRLATIGVAKQDANRLLEPFMFTTIVATACDRAWEWFFSLRDDSQADPKFAEPAHLMHVAYRGSAPRLVADGDWHLPYIEGPDIAAARRSFGFCDSETLAGMQGEDRVLIQQTMARMSAARCARISYLRQHEERPLEDEVSRARELVRMRHWSPTEHQARSNHEYRGRMSGNLGPGWLQHRHLIGDGYNAIPVLQPHLILNEVEQ